MSVRLVTLVEVACDKDGCLKAIEGCQHESVADVRAWVQSHGWDISDDGDWCPDHKGIPACIRGRRAVERAEAESVLSSLRVKLSGEGTEG